MDGFLSWFFVFITKMFQAVWDGISHFFIGIWNILDIPSYVSLLNQYKDNFGPLDWVLSILAFIVVYAFWAVIIGLIVLVVRKYVRFRRSLVGNDDLLEEISSLHIEIDRLTKEKERLLALRLNASGVEVQNMLENQETERKEEEKAIAASPTVSRFARLTLVDSKYQYYIAPEYNNEMSLKEICDDLRNFASYRSKLYYEIKTIRLMIAGLASTKLVILQGISGTGKTSLPYVMGKYFANDITIAPVQPAWRERSELFGYFNEFSKKFNETEVLKRIYDAGYNDNINIVVLDEMNIARIEYYFAEMLSILELPDKSEWKIELVPSSWDDDPVRLVDGKLTIPQNVWYVGTANNDDSTFTISDKVYDRAFTINLDQKGQPFEGEPTQAKQIAYSYVEDLYAKAQEEHAVSDEMLAKLGKLDEYIIDHFRVAFGNRIVKQIKQFVPVYVACGGDEIEGLDYIVATKIVRKFESLNLGLIRDEIKGLINYLNMTFGNGKMEECINYLHRLQKMY